MSLEEVLLQACLNFRGSLAEPISLFPSKFTQMPDKQAFFNSAHCAPEQESYRLLISPGGTLFGVCFQKKRQDCFLAVFSGKINEDKINFSISHRGVTIRLDDFLYDFKQAKKKKKKKKKKSGQALYLGMNNISSRRLFSRMDLPTFSVCPEGNIRWVKTFTL